MTTTDGMHVEILRCERRVKPQLAPSLHLDRGLGGGTPREGWSVEVRAHLHHRPGLNRLNLSKLDGEDRWWVDALYSTAGVPLHVVGFGGGRWADPIAVPPALAEALDEAVRAAESGATDRPTEHPDRGTRSGPDAPGGAA